MSKYDSLCDGRIFESAKPVRVTNELIADFCAAIGETNPLYTDLGPPAWGRIAAS